MPALDTNVLVRYIVQDDAAQLAVAARFINRCLAEGATLFVPVTVVLELEWVLRCGFEFSKDDVLMALSSLLSAAELRLRVGTRTRGCPATVPQKFGGLRGLPSHCIGHAGR